MNAVAHRDYEEAGAKITVEVFADRVVFSSPGLPPGNQKIDQIARGDGRSRARNPLIVQGLTWLEFMDERGSGIRRMRESMERHGLELPRFALAGDEFTVTLPARQQTTELLASPRTEDTPDLLSTFKALTEHQLAVLKRVLDSGHVQTAWCVQNLGISRDTAWRLLNDLLEQGLLITAGTGRGTRYVSGSQLTDQAHRAQVGRKDQKSGANRAQRREVGRKPGETRQTLLCAQAQTAFGSEKAMNIRMSQECCVKWLFSPLPFYLSPFLRFSNSSRRPSAEVALRLQLGHRQRGYRGFDGTTVEQIGQNCVAIGRLPALIKEQAC